MPLEGFRVLEWAQATFGGIPPLLMGGLALLVLITGVVLAVIGAKMVPVSAGLITAGLSLCVLTYFIVGATIAGLSSQVAGQAEVSAAAVRVVPWAAGLVPAGLGLFGLRAALRSWSSEEGSGKAVGVIFALVSVVGIFVGVQVVRGSLGQRPPAEPAAEAETHRPAWTDEPIRRRGVTAPRR